jgi:hypothetical protein
MPWNPLWTVAALFWGSVVAGAISICIDPATHGFVRQHRAMVLTLIALTVAFRIPPDGRFFHGMEYEDAYIYTIAGRQIIAAPAPPVRQAGTPYSVSTCALGSIASCEVWEPFPEHLIGYPYLIAVASWIFGYSPSIGSIVNVFVSVCATFLTFCIVLNLTSDVLAALLAGLVFAVTPVFAVYGLETSAEPLSNLCMTAALWYFLRFVEFRRDNVWMKTFTWIAYTTTLLYALLVKREDLLLPIAAVASLPFALRGDGWARRAKVRTLALLSLPSLLAAGLAALMGLRSTTATEADVLRRFPITAAHLFAFVSGFLRSFWVLHWYAGTAVLVLAGIVAAFVKFPRTLVPVILLIAYVIVYAFHVRGFYEMAAGHVELDAALRFSMNMMTLWAVVAGCGGAFLVSKLRAMKWFHENAVLRRYLAMGALSLIALPLWWTLRLREYETEDEWRSRFTPAAAAVEYAQRAQTSLYVVTMEPLTVQMLADPNLRVVDLEAADLGALHELVSKARNNPLLVLRQDDGHRSLRRSAPIHPFNSPHGDRTRRRLSTSDA